jgi:predicted nucleotidyltransferase component of viral defense system
VSRSSKESRFFKEAQLMLQVLPFVAEEKSFALKGGTAINCFLRDLPRLSVDIDLTYLPIQDRKTSLEGITKGLKFIQGRIAKARPDLRVQEGKVKNSDIVCKLHVSNAEAQIKVEPNLVLRGSVFPIRELRVAPEVEKLFETSAKIQVVSYADLYGGKLCAALDRQHPRDLFDVKILFESEGITSEIRKGFVIFLACHDETMSQLLKPELKNIEKAFQDEFSEMPVKPVSLDELIDVRKKLIETIIQELSLDDRHFLLSLKQGTPEWDRLGVEGVDQLPAIQWKLANIKKMKPDHHKRSVDRLKQILGI